MYSFKPIRPSDISREEIEVHKIFTLGTGSVSSVQYISGSSANSGSYWDSIRVNFYLSGSAFDNPKSSSFSRYSSPLYSLDNTYNIENPRHLNKFMISGSVISISQRHFGDYIVPDTFELVDNSTSTEVIIRDDGFGNLYPVGNTISESNSSPSSSDNYIGNIFYRLGVATITTTGSYDSGVKYTDITTGNYRVSFDSSHKIYSQQYNLVVSPNEFNITMNPTARQFVSSSNDIFRHPGADDRSRSPLPRDEITGSNSNWSPYVTTIGFYDEYKKLCMVARYSKPIKLRKDMEIKFQVKMDW